jgi:hypothetical protein
MQPLSAKWLRVSLLSAIAMALLLVSAPVFSQQDREDLKDGFYGQRTYPSGRIPPNALANARAQLAKQKALSPTSLPTATWAPIGPQPTTPRDLSYRGSPVVAGRVTAVAVDSSNPQRVFIGGAVGGVWGTTNGGSTWTPLTDNQVSLSIGSIAIDPTNSNTIYVGTGEQDYLNSYYGAGILKSTDGGNTWTQYGQSAFVGPFSASAGGAYIGSLAIDTNKGYIFAGVLENGGTGSGIYVSMDSGNTWSVSLSGAAGNEVLYDANSGYLYAALGSCGSVCGSSGSLQTGIFLSQDDGATWTSLNSGLPTTNVGRIGLALFPSVGSTPAILYAGIANFSDGSILGVWKSTDGGTTWGPPLTLPGDYCTPQCWFDNVVAVSPTNSNVVFVAGKVPVYQSLDGGSTWTDMSTTGSISVHSDTHALTFSADGSLLYIGDDGGVWVGTTPSTSGLSWSALNNPLALTQFYKGFSISPASVNTTLGGTQDNGTQLYSGSANWTQVICGDGGATAINPVQPNIVFAECVSNSGPTIFKSTSGGGAGTFVESDTGITASDRSFFGETLVIDPSNPQVMYFGSYRVYQTTNGAQSWSLISQDLTKAGDGGYISALAVAPGSNTSAGSTSQVVYATTSDGNVWVTANAASGTGAVWNKRTTGLPNRWVTEVFPTNATTAYLSFSGFYGFNGDDLGHVFMTTNTGQSWTDVSPPGGSLPNIPVNDIVVDPQSPSMIYLATDVGVLGSTDAGTTWTTLGTALPNTASIGFRIHAASRILRVATHGRSMWDLQLQDFGISLSPNKSTVTAGQTATSVITLTPNSSGFGTPIMLACSGLPSGATCQFNNNNVTPGATAALVNLSIPTAAAQGGSRTILNMTDRNQERARNGIAPFSTFGLRNVRNRGFAAAIALSLGVMCFAFLADISRKSVPGYVAVVLLGCCIIALVLQIACGGSSSSSPQNQAPAFTSANNTTFGLGTAGSFTVATTGTPTATVTESGTLPAGITFTPNTSGGGVLGGTPTATGTSQISFTASNSVGQVTQNFTLTITSSTFSVVITGTSGSVQHSATLQLTLQ